MKLLIKLGILVAIMLSSFLGNAQSKSDRIYDTFAGKDGVVTLSFSKSVLKPFEIFIDDDTKKVIYKMKKVRFMTYNEDKGELDAFNVLERILNEFDSREYFKIDPEEFDCEDCDVNIDSNDELYLFGHGKRKDMDEFHALFFDNEQCFLFSFYGDITINDLKGCARFSKGTKSIYSL